MKKEQHFVEVHLCRKSSKVISSDCSCPAGNSGYWNHIVAMLYELADYSLHSLKSVPLESAYTSKSDNGEFLVKNTAEKLRLWRQ